MRSRSLSLSLLLLLTGLASSTVVGGCYHHGYGRGGEWHWADSEEPYYERWEHETHRDHRDYGQRGNDEQHEYQQWRQSHS